MDSNSNPEKKLRVLTSRDFVKVENDLKQTERDLILTWVEWGFAAARRGDSITEAKRQAAVLYDYLHK